MCTGEDIEQLGEAIITESEFVTVCKMKTHDEVRLAVVSFAALTFDHALKMLTPQFHGVSHMKGV